MYTRSYVQETYFKLFVFKKKQKKTGQIVKVTLFMIRLFCTFQTLIALINCENHQIQSL